MADFEAKGCKSGSWLADRLCPKREVSWAEVKRNIYMNDFIYNTRIWMTIICSWVSSYTHTTIVPNMQDRTVACILDGILLNVGQHVLSEVKF